MDRFECGSWAEVGRENGWGTMDENTATEWMEVVFLWNSGEMEDRRYRDPLVQCQSDSGVSGSTCIARPQASLIPVRVACSRLAYRAARKPRSIKRRRRKTGARWRRSIPRIDSRGRSRNRVEIRASWLSSRGTADVRWLFWDPARGSCVSDVREIHTRWPRDHPDPLSFYRPHADK